MPPIILASTSRYRRELLERLGLPFTARSPGVAEDAVAGEAPAAMASRLALAKAASIDDANTIVIGSDQVASLDGKLLRKPGSAKVAVEQLRLAQGKTVLFHTAVAVIATGSGT